MAATEEALWQAVTEAPVDPLPVQVLADWLVQHGDPRGEPLQRLISGEDPARVLEQHGRLMLGIAWSVYSHRRPSVLEWRNGFPRAFRVEDAHRSPAVWARALQTWTFCILERLVIEGHSTGKLLAEMEPMPQVRALQIRSSGDAIYTWQGDGLALEHAFPKLQRAHIFGEFEALSLPASVRHLELAGEVCEVAPFWDLDLVHLGLEQVEDLGSWMQRLASSRLLSTLECLDLSRNSLPAEASWVVPADFAHLELIPPSQV